MKILMVTNALGPVYGGPPIFIFHLAQALGSQGVQVDIVATNANGSLDLPVALRTWLPEKFYRVQYFPRWQASGEYKFSRSLSQWLFQHVATYDLVHTHGLFCYPVLPAYGACWVKRVPYIVTPHGMLEPWALARKAPKKRLYYTLFEKPALDHANMIHLVARPEAENAASLHLKTPLAVIPVGIWRQDFEILPDPDLFFQQFPVTRGKKLILFLGRIDPKKGLDLLAAAFGQARQQFTDAHLIVAGPDNIGFSPTAQDYFAQAGCLESVTFTGMLTGPLKQAALAAASIYVAPSYSEGFSMSVLEGMASGLPCIITTGCNFPEAGAAQAAYVVEAKANEIGEALIQCLQDPQSAATTGKHARQLIFEQYTWERIASRLIEVYGTILNKYSRSTVKYGGNQLENSG